jgi:Zn-dependent M28 family amino/carboxypeptidase
VVLFANEENGLSGAEAYAAAHAAELPNHVLAMEADAGTGAVYEARFGGTDDGRPSFEWVTAPLERLGIARGSSRAHGGADVSPLRKLGVPVIDLQQDMSTYFDVHHTVNDVFERIDPPALAQASTAFALVLRRALGRAEGFGRASGPAQPEGFGRNVTAPTLPATK